MKIIIIAVVLLLTGCSTFNPVGGGNTRYPGTYTINIAPTGCGAVIDSNTLKGGPNVIVTRAPDGACSIEVKHNPSITELQPLLNILGGTL